jgi:hypothetical protein
VQPPARTQHSIVSPSGQQSIRGGREPQGSAGEHTPANIAMASKKRAALMRRRSYFGSARDDRGRAGIAEPGAPGSL